MNGKNHRPYSRSEIIIGEVVGISLMTGVLYCFLIFPVINASHILHSFHATESSMNSLFLDFILLFIGLSVFLPSLAIQVGEFGKSHKILQYLEDILYWLWEIEVILGCVVIALQFWNPRGSVFNLEI